jgi:hypothetical protein
MTRLCKAKYYKSVIYEHGAMEHVVIRGFDKETEDCDKESSSIKKEINSNNSNKDYE